MSDGIGCQCYARCSSECGCENVDWTPREVIELRNQLSHLQKLCEEQKGEIERFKNSVPGSVKSYIAQIEHLNRKVEALEWAIGEWKKEEVLWKEREANLSSEVDRQTEKLCYENAALQSQLATQTERVGRLEINLRRYGFHKPECNRYIWDGWTTLENGTKYALLAEDMNCACTCGFEQALNQESPKGEQSC